MNLRLRTIAVAFLTALSLSACGNSAPANDDALRIALINPTSGASSWAGVPISRGVETAVREINDSNFLGERRIELTSVDSEGDPAVAISQYRGFAADDYLGVICCSISSEAGAFRQLAERAEMPTVANGATLEGLNAPPYLYRTTVLPAAEGGMYDRVVDTVVQKRRPRTAAIVQTADNEGNVSDANRWNDSLASHGVQVVDRVDVFAEDTDFTVPAAKINSLNADLLVLSTQGPTSATMIKLLRERGYRGLITSSYGLATRSMWELGGQALAGSFFAIPFTPVDQSPRTSEFVASYQQDWNEVPDLYSAQGYNAMWFLAQGMKQAGEDVTRESLARALSEIREFSFASGLVVGMQDGQAVLTGDDFPIVQWNQDGTQSLWSPGAEG